MADNIKTLAEKRDALLPRLYELRDKVADTSQTLSEEDEANWKAINDDLNDLDHRIETLKAIETHAAKATAPAEPGIGRHDFDNGDKRKAASGGVTDEHRALAFQAWFAKQSGYGLTDEQRDAVTRTGLPVERPYLDVPLCSRAAKTAAEVRTMSGLEGSAGGYLSPVSFVTSLEQAMLAFGSIRAGADIIRTENGNPMDWPTSNDTSNTGEQLGDGSAVTSQDVTVGQVTWNAYNFSSKLVKVPVSLLEDSAFDLPTFLGGVLGERLGRIQNTSCTTGAGAAGPKGIITAATSGKTTASSTAITFDEVLDLIYSVDASYRIGANFMLHDNVEKALRKLKDGQGQYLWSAGDVTAGIPATIWGYPTIINRDMSSTITSGDKTMLFGQLSKYKIREVRGVRLRRLVERYAEYDQEGFVAFLRFDGNLLDAGTNPVKYMAQL